MKKLLAQFAPSLLIKTLKEPRAERTPQFASYREALDYCQAGGYQSADVVKAVVEKYSIHRNKICSQKIFELDALRMMVGLGALSNQSTLRVLDFGGGGGIHHSIARVVLGKHRDIRWNVVETGAMAKAAARLAGDGLKFFDDMDEAAADLGDVDLVFTSGALQYTPDPLASLRDLISVNAKHLFITRTAFSESDDTLITVQTSMLSSNGPGPLPAGFKDHKIFYPISFASKAKAERLLGDSYEIRFALEEDLNAYSALGQSFRMYGYFCDLK